MLIPRPAWINEVCVCIQVLKLLAEMSPFCGDMDKLESNLNMLFIKLLVRKTSVYVTRWRPFKWQDSSCFHC